MNLIGVGSIPLILFVLGGTLSNGPTAGSSSALPPKCLVACLVAKLLLVPTANMAIVWLALQVCAHPSAPCGSPTEARLLCCPPCKAKGRRTLAAYAVSRI